MAEALWRILQKDQSDLTCDECLAFMEYGAELLAQGGRAILPGIIEHLEGCPSCDVEHRAALQRLMRMEKNRADRERASGGRRALQAGDRR